KNARKVPSEVAVSAGAPDSGSCGTATSEAVVAFGETVVCQSALTEIPRRCQTTWTTPSGVRATPPTSVGRTPPTEIGVQRPGTPAAATAAATSAPTSATATALRIQEGLDRGVVGAPPGQHRVPRARPRLLVGAPAEKPGAVPEAVPLNLVVADLADQLRAHR